jgi:hypothetical protein
MERHAKDFFGKSLYVGDIVATLKPGYRYSLARATVTRVTPKALRVRIDGAQSDVTVFEVQVVKAWRQGP